MQHDPLVTVATLVAAALIPSLIYVAILRNSERAGRQTWGSVLYAFMYGAVVSVILVLVATWLIGGLLGEAFGNVLNRFTEGAARFGPQAVAIVAVAPVVEEFFKGFGLRKTRKHTREIEDGIIYAGAIALGFAATENLLYQTSAFLEGGAADWWSVVVARSISSALLHPAATGLIGLGYGKMVVRGTSRVRLLPYYGGAVALHGIYNYSAVTGLVLFPGLPLHLPVAVVLAIVGFWLLHRSIVKWDRRQAPPAQAA